MTDITEPEDHLSPKLAQLKSELANVQLLVHMQGSVLREKGLSQSAGIVQGLKQIEKTLDSAIAEMQHQSYFQAQLRALASIGQAINSSLNTSEVLNHVIDTILRLTGAERAFLMLKTSNGELDFLVARHFTRDELEDEDFAISRTVVEDVARTGSPIVTTNAQHDPRFGQQMSVLSYHLLSILCVPLRVVDDITGVIYVDSRIKAGVFTPQDRDILTAFADQAGVAIQNARLFEAIQMAYDETLLGWARALELRDNETSGHSQRVTELSVALAQHLGQPESEIINIRRGALLHDIGKMAVPDSILRKPGSLSDEERVVMQDHPAHATDMLGPITFLKGSLDIPRFHHERWDGTGYPYQLAGEEIPLAARIFSVVDVYDALRYARPYREAWPYSQVVAHILELSGKHFDPHVVSAFLEILPNHDPDPTS